MSDQAALYILQDLAKKLGCVLVPVGCVRNAQTSYRLEPPYLPHMAIPDGFLRKEVEHHLLQQLTDVVAKVATKEIQGHYPYSPATHTIRLTTVDVPAYLRWADHNGLKPFLTPYGFDFNHT